MYNRYRKRDKSEINRKDEVGLGRVDNYSSSDISEAVMHSVRDYLYTPYYNELVSDRKGSLRIFRFMESGHTMCITGLNTTLDSGERHLMDTLSGSFLYDKPKALRPSMKCPVSFDLLADLDNSEILINSYLVVTCIEGRGDITTYISLDMYDQSPYIRHGVRWVGTNLHDYTLGAVDYDTDWLGESYQYQWRFRIGDWVGTKKCTVAVPMYNEFLGDYVVTDEGMNVNLGGTIDTASINGVPFCGAYKVMINGKDARHITVPAFHSGPTKSQAGAHDWEVLSKVPVGQYHEVIDGTGKKYSTHSALTSDQDKNGLCTLSEANTSLDNMKDFLDSLGYFTDLGVKVSNKSDSTVITVAILKKFYDLLRLRLDELDAKINEGLAPKLLYTEVDLGSSIGSLALSSPGKLTGTFTLTGTETEIWSDSSKNTTKNTKKLRYFWDYGTECPLTVTTNLTTISGGTGYTTVSSLKNLQVTISLQDRTDLASFTGRPIVFETIGESGETATTTVYLNYTNGNTIDLGSFAGTLQSGASASSGNYKPLGYTYNINLSVDQYRDLTSGRYKLYLSPAKKVNGSYTQDSSVNLSILSMSSGASGTLEKGTGGVYTLTALLAEPGVSKYTWSYTIGTDDTPYIYVNITVAELDGSMSMSPSSQMIFSSHPTDTSLLVITSNYQIQAPEVKSYTWINVIQSSVSGTKYYYNIGASDYTGDTDRVGYVKFSNTAGQYVTLTVKQTCENKYIYVTTSQGDTLYPESTASVYSSDTTHQESYRFTVYSNIPFDVYNGDTKISSSGSAPTGSLVSIDIQENLTTSPVVTNLYVRSKLNDITMKVIKPGREPEDPEVPAPDPVFEVTLPDLVFKKEDAFDILRTEKLIKINCDDPNKVTLEVLSRNGQLVAKKWAIGSKELYIHAYPRTVGVWSSHTEDLAIKYDGKTMKTITFSFEDTHQTVGTYFNVSDTILSYEYSETTTNTLVLTAFSMESADNLELSYNGPETTPPIKISSKTKTSFGGGTNLFARWTITIPPGKKPKPGTPWTLKVTHSTSEHDKYVSIYEDRDVHIDKSTGTQIQVTAMGHLGVVDGCTVRALIYQINPKSYFNGDPANKFDYVSIIHDFSYLRMSETRGGGYWSFDQGYITYDTRTDHVLWGSGYTSIAKFELGDLTSYLGHSECLDYIQSVGGYYRDGGPGSEAIGNYYDEPHNGTFPVLPSSEYSLFPVNLCTSDDYSRPEYWETPGRSTARIHRYGWCFTGEGRSTILYPNFFPCPPDWTLHRIYASWNDTPNGNDNWYTNDGYHTDWEPLPQDHMGWDDNVEMTIEIDTMNILGDTVSGIKRTNYGMSCSYRFGVERSCNEYQPEGTSIVIEGGKILYDYQDTSENANRGFTVYPSLSRNRTSDPFQVNAYGRVSTFRQGFYDGVYTLSHVGTASLPVGNKLVITGSFDIDLGVNNNSGEKTFRSSSPNDGCFCLDNTRSIRFYDLQDRQVRDLTDTDELSGNLHQWVRNIREKDYTVAYQENYVYDVTSDVKNCPVRIQFGISGISSPGATSDIASTVNYLPYARLTDIRSQKTMEFILINPMNPGGLGMNEFNLSQGSVGLGAAADFKFVRTKIGTDNVFLQDFSIQCSSGITFNATSNPGAKIVKAPCLFINSVSTSYNPGYIQTDGKINITITHQDMCNMISHLVETYSIRTTGSTTVPGYDYDWVFEASDDLCFDSSQTFQIAQYCYLRDFKVKIE